MPTINKRFLTKLLLTVAAFMGVLFSVHALQARRIPDALKSQAERAVANNKPDAAIRHLRQYLEFRPDDVAVQEQLADMLRLRGGSANELHFLYDRILRGDSERTATRKEALLLALKTGRLTDAVTHAEALLKLSPNDAVVWQQLAAAQAGLRQFDSAKASYETAVKLNPKDAVAWQRLAQFLVADIKKPKDAAIAIDRMVAALPNDATAYLTRVRLALMSESPLPPMKSDPVLADLAKALELSPNNPDVLLFQAERLQKHRDIVGARLALGRGVEKYPGDQRLVRALAWLEVNRHNTAGAIGVLEDALPHAKDSLDLLVTLADLVLDAGDVAKAEDILKKLERRPGPTAKMQAKYLKGRLAMRASQWNDAIAIFVSLRTDAVNLPGLETQANMLLAACYQKIGEPAKAIDSYKLVTAKDATQVSAFIGLGQLYLNAGRHADAIKSYESAVQSPFAPTSAITLLIRMQALQLAHANAKPEAWTQLEKQIAEYAPRYGTNAVEPVILRAELAAHAGSWKNAVTILKKESARRPQSTTLWCKLAEAVGNVEGVAAGLTVLDEAQGFVNDSAELRLARGKLYANDPLRLRPLDLLVSQTETWSDAEQMLLLTGMVEIYDRLEDSNPEVWQRLLTRRPNDVDLLVSACRSSMYRTYLQPVPTQFEKLEPRLIPFVKSLLLLSFRTCSSTLERKGSHIGCGFSNPQPSEYTNTIAELQNAYGLEPARADVCIVMARLQLLTGQLPQAKKMIERAGRLEPNRFETMAARLTMCIFENDANSMKQILTQLQLDPRWAGEPLRRVVQQGTFLYRASGGRQTPASPAPVITVSASEKQEADAPRSPQHVLLAAVKPIVEREPGGLGWLADQYKAIDADTIAMSAAESAVASNMVTVDDWLRLFSLTSPENDARERISQRAEKALPNHYAIFSASWHALPGSRDANPGSWTDYVKASLAIHMARMNRPGSIQLLEEFLANKDNTLSVRAWATRNLAMLLVVRGEAADRERAAKLLTDAALSDAGSTLSDRRATAGVLASLHRYLDGDTRTVAMKKAIELMEAVAKESNTPKDAFALCRLYKAVGRSEDAVAKLRQLLASDPGNLDYLLAGLDVLVEAKQAESAKGFAERLLQLGGGEYRVVAAVAKYECLYGDVGKAHALAEGYFRSADPLAGDVIAKTLRTAELHDDLARLALRNGKSSDAFVDSAVAKYETLLPGRAEVLVKLASLLATTGRIDEAFTRLEKLQRGTPVRIVATAAVTALSVARGNEKHFARTKLWIEAAKTDDANAIRLCEAEFLTLQGDHVAAAAIYEAILKDQPRSVAALNNLAWLLSAKPETAKRALELLEKASQEIGLTGELLDTRSRIRLALNEPMLAVADAGEALKHEKTALRYFHLALATQAVKPEETAAYFQESKQRGLTERMVHPLDVAAFRQFNR